MRSLFQSSVTGVSLARRTDTSARGMSDARAAAEERVWRGQHTGHPPEVNKWTTAPLWLKLLCVAGIPWCIAWVVMGVPYLVEAGAGLPRIWLGMLGLTPWLFLLLRKPQTPR